MSNIVAEKMKEISGSRVLESGVGTHMEMASHSAKRLMSAVASRRPPRTSLPTSSSVRS